MTSNVLPTYKKSSIALLSSLALLSGVAASSAAVVVGFDQAKPTTDILTFNDPGIYQPGGYAWLSETTPSGITRQLAQTFSTNGIASPAFELTSLTMHGRSPYDLTGGSYTFSISFYEVDTLTGAFVQDPTKLIATHAGSISAEAASPTERGWITFDFDTAITLEANKSYAYVMSWDSPQANQRLEFTFGDPKYDAAVGRAWVKTGTGEWSNIDGAMTYAFYIQGTEAIPEGETLALLPMGALAIGLLARRRRRLATQS